MKKTTVQISFGTEKLRAIHRYMQDETELQAELDTLLQTLYEKHVPAIVREYIESRDASMTETPGQGSCPAADDRKDRETTE